MHYVGKFRCNSPNFVVWFPIDHHLKIYYCWRTKLLLYEYILTSVKKGPRIVYFCFGVTRSEFWGGLLTNTGHFKKKVIIS